MVFGLRNGGTLNLMSLLLQYPLLIPFKAVFRGGGAVGETPFLNDSRLLDR